MPPFDINSALSDPRVALGIGLLTARTPQEGISQGVGLLSKQSELERQRRQDELERRYKESQIKKNELGDDPATVREWQYYNALPVPDQERFLNMKRAQQVINLGGSQAVRSPLGGIAESYPVTPKLSEMPAFMAEQTAAIETAKRDAENQQMQDKKAVQAKDVVTLADQAEQYLDAGSGGIFNRIGLAGKQAIGSSDENTQAAANLQVIGNRIVSAMPRMEGPQSNYDVQLYKDMAGRVADPGVPAGDKRAALKTLKELNAKYTAGSQLSGGSARTVVKTQTSPSTGKKRIIYSDGTTEIIN